MPNLRNAFVSAKTDSADTTLVRPTNWNSNLQYNTSAGQPSGVDAFVREALTANLDFYVRQDGSNSNSGLVNSAGGAFLTFAHAWDVISNTLDFGGHDVSIGMGAGTWTNSCAFYQPWVGGGNIYLYGLGSGTTIINTAGVDAIGITSLGAMPGSIYVDLMRVAASGGGCGIRCGQGAFVYVGAVDFGTCTGGQHMQAGGGGIISTVDNYTISGDANNHAIGTGAGSNIFLYGTPTGTATFSNAFATTQGPSYVESIGISFAGVTATGRRYNANGNGLIQTFASGAAYFPGTSAGVTSDGGVYA